MPIHTAKNVENRSHSAPSSSPAPQSGAVAGSLIVTALADCVGDLVPPLLVVLIDEILDGAKHDCLGIDADTIGG